MKFPLKSVLSFLFLWVALPASLRAQTTDRSARIDSLFALADSASIEDEQLRLETLNRREVWLRERKGWLSSLKIGVQFLSFSQDMAANTGTVGVLPSLGINLQIDLERLSTMGSRIRAAKNDTRIAELQRERQRKELRLFIEENYFDYLQLVEETKIRLSAQETVRQQFVLVEERFKRGEADFTVFLQASQAYDQARENYQKSRLLSEKKWALLESTLQNIKPLN